MKAIVIVFGEKNIEEKEDFYDILKKLKKRARKPNSFDKIIVVDKFYNKDTDVENYNVIHVESETFKPEKGMHYFFALNFNNTIGKEKMFAKIQEGGWLYNVGFVHNGKFVFEGTKKPKTHIISKAIKSVFAKISVLIFVSFGMVWIALFRIFEYGVIILSGIILGFIWIVGFIPTVFFKKTRAGFNGLFLDIIKFHCVGFNIDECDHCNSDGSIYCTDECNKYHDEVRLKLNKDRDRWNKSFWGWLDRKLVSAEKLTVYDANYNDITERVEDDVFETADGVVMSPIGPKIRKNKGEQND